MYYLKYTDHTLPNCCIIKHYNMYVILYKSYQKYYEFKNVLKN